MNHVVVTPTGSGWLVRWNGMPQRKHEQKASAVDHGTHLARRTSAELEIRRQNGSVQRHTTTYTRSRGY